MERLYTGIRLGCIGEHPAQCVRDPGCSRMRKRTHQQQHHHHHYQYLASPRLTSGLVKTSRRLIYGGRSVPSGRDVAGLRTFNSSGNPQLSFTSPSPTAHTRRHTHTHTVTHTYIHLSASACVHPSLTSVHLAGLNGPGVILCGLCGLRMWVESLPAEA